MSIKINLESFKEFKPTSWSIKQKTFTYILILCISFGGIYQFLTLPKESFPDIVIPTIFIQTINVGNSPKDIENLITRPIEKQIKSITGAKINKFTSTSQQDFSAITVEFSTDVNTQVAIDKVKDAVDRAQSDLPTNLTQDPKIIEISLSDQPVMYVNISGDFNLQKLKYYADELKDRFESLSELSRVDIVGSPEREFQINVDKNIMEISNITYDDISNAVSRENLDVSAGLVKVDNMNRNLQVIGQLKSKQDIEN
ncbi:MAG: efflux RND transporter permease subunit, partial [Sediminibacterium sp.]|nr:efflux RND transporter permease subunit [Sediminibacterium sp.]